MENEKSNIEYRKKTLTIQLINLSTYQPINLSTYQPIQLINLSTTIQLIN